MTMTLRELSDKVNKSHPKPVTFPASDLDGLRKRCIPFSVPRFGQVTFVNGPTGALIWYPVLGSFINRCRIRSWVIIRDFYVLYWRSDWRIRLRRMIL